MGDIGVDNWTVDKESEQCFKLSSPEGTVVAKQVEDDESLQTWFVDTNLEGIEPKSWQVQVEEKSEIVDRLIPEILTERVPANSKSRSI